METKRTNLADAGTVDEKRCPLCGGDNRCGYLAGQAAGTCWCVRDFPKKIVELVPPNLKGKACICPDCVAKFREGTFP